MNKEFNCSNCLSVEFNLLDGMYFDNKEETNDYVLCTSKTMDDYFWNLAYIKNKLDNNTLIEIENKLKKLNRVPSIYIGRDDEYFENNKSFLLENNYELIGTDVFMVLSDFKKIDVNLKIKVVENESEYTDYMKVLSSAYNDNIENASENVYADAVTKCYYDAIKNSMKNGKAYHIICYNENNIPVSVATLSIFNEAGLINNVGTAQGYWNKGYSKQVLSYLIDLFKEKGGKDLLLCTEYQSKNQSYYEKLGFKEIFVMEEYILRGNKMDNIIVTSGGFNTVNNYVSEENIEMFKEISKGKKVLIIANAAPEGTGNYIARENVRDNFLNAGAIQADVIDLDESNVDAMLEYDVIYGLGGDITKLIELNANTRFKEVLLKFLEHGIYIGESAGSMILSDDLKYCYDLKRGTKPKYDVVLDSYAGLGLIDIYLYPHFQKASEEMRNKATALEEKDNIKITRLNDGEIITYSYSNNKLL